MWPCMKVSTDLIPLIFWQMWFCNDLLTNVISVFFDDPHAGVSERLSNLFRMACVASKNISMHELHVLNNYCTGRLCHVVYKTWNPVFHTSLVPNKAIKMNALNGPSTITWSILNARFFFFYNGECMMPSVDISWLLVRTSLNVF